KPRKVPRRSPPSGPRTVTRPRSDASRAAGETARARASTSSPVGGPAASAPRAATNAATSDAAQATAKETAMDAAMPQRADALARAPKTLIGRDPAPFRDGGPPVPRRVGARAQGAVGVSLRRSVHQSGRFAPSAVADRRALRARCTSSTLGTGAGPYRDGTPGTPRA